MKVISINLNGLRAAHRKGFFPWLEKEDADIVCVQETRIHTTQLTEELLSPLDYQGYLYSSQRKGYSGVGIYTRTPADRVFYGHHNSHLINEEGRFIQLNFGNLSVVSLYLPSGTTGDERQQVKYHMMDVIMDWCKECRQDGREYLLCGDWNIAHTELDLRNHKGNRNHSGFLPKERQWLDELFDDVGFVDVFRQLNPDGEEYTWWSNRGRAWERNVGWRIDYQIATPGLAELATSYSIYTDQRFSDHAPLIMEYNYSLD